MYRIISAKNIREMEELMEAEMEAGCVLHGPMIVRDDGFYQVILGGQEIDVSDLEETTNTLPHS
jgi:hypothetical protein